MGGTPLYRIAIGCEPRVVNNQTDFYLFHDHYYTKPPKPTTPHKSDFAFLNLRRNAASSFSRYIVNHQKSICENVCRFVETAKPLRTLRSLRLCVKKNSSTSTLPHGLKPIRPKLQLQA
jgi:hypothetical protein